MFRTTPVPSGNGVKTAEGDFSMRIARERISAGLSFRKRKRAGWAGTSYPLQTAVEQPGRQLSAASNAGLLIDLVQVFVDRFNADLQLFGDLEILFAAKTLDRYLGFT